MANKLEQLIREEAAKKDNMLQYEFQRKHHEICSNLVKMADEYNFPMGVLVYIAVGTNAHRLNVFEKGYNRFMPLRAEKIIKLCTIIDKKLNSDKNEKKVNYRTNDRIVHMCSRYYDVTKGNENKLRQILNKADLPNVKAYLKKANPTAKMVAQMIFGDFAQYGGDGEKKTYMVKIKK